jgi:hypothetical protein
MMAEETAQKKRLTKGQAIGVMVAGGIMMILPMILSTEQGSTAHMVKVAIGFLGFCVLCAGAYFRP